ncbi:hypothetical protein, partial [Providencia burhodogranariea]
PFFILFYSTAAFHSKSGVYTDLPTKLSTFRKIIKIYRALRKRLRYNWHENSSLILFLCSEIVSSL